VTRKAKTWEHGGQEEIYCVKVKQKRGDKGTEHHATSSLDEVLNYVREHIDGQRSKKRICVKPKQKESK
jgi:hypothetical protein